MNAPLAAAGLVVKVARVIWKQVPQRLRKQLEDRVYYAIYQTTRVTNDAYGWRPPPPPDPPPG